MSAINLAYKTDLVYSEVIDNTIILKRKDNNKVIYKFPVPKRFQIVGILKGAENINIDTYIITPYKLNKPNFIPEGYANLRLGSDGLWHMDNGKHGLDGDLNERKVIAYIDTTLLSPKDFDYPTIGNFKIAKDDIPSPFWMPKFSGGWKKTSDIQKDVKKFAKHARLIYEEELISVFALNDLGFEFCENISNDICETNLKYFRIGMHEFCLDNWEIIAASRANRNLYRIIYKEKDRMRYEKYWYSNRAFVHNDDKEYPFHIFPVLDGRDR